jgi:hypothetical protein
MRLELPLAIDSAGEFPALSIQPQLWKDSRKGIAVSFVEAGLLAKGGQSDGVGVDAVKPSERFDQGDPAGMERG